MALLKMLMSLAITAFFIGAGRSQTALQETKELTKNVYSFANIAGPFSLFSMFIVTKNGVIVIEPYNTQHSTLLLAAIRKITRKPIRLLLISHNHWDHANGGKVFADVGAKVMAHKEAIEWMEANPHPDLYIPKKSWRGNFRQLCIGGEILELHYFGMNHGLGMTVFLYKSPNGADKNIMFIADILTPRSILFSILPDFNLKETERTYREVIKLPAERIVFTHNPRNVEGSKNDVKRILKYVVALREAVAKALAKGGNLLAIPNTIDLPEFQDLDGYAENLPLNALKMGLEQFIGPFPWRKIKFGGKKKW